MELKSVLIHTECEFKQFIICNPLLHFTLKKKELKPLCSKGLMKNYLQLTEDKTNFKKVSVYYT